MTLFSQLEKTNQNPLAVKRKDLEELWKGGERGFGKEKKQLRTVAKLQSPYLCPPDHIPTESICTPPFDLWAPD